MSITIYQSDVVWNNKNTYYPHEIEITTKDELKNAIMHDHTFIRFKDFKRSKDNFLSTKMIVLDVDNDHSESEWLSPMDVSKFIPDVSHIVITSRNHLKEKNGISPRPRFHVLFPVKEIDSANKYEVLITKVCSIFPFFDNNAIDAGRFFYASNNPEIYYFKGSMQLDDFIYLYKEPSIDSDLSPINEGSRNTTMHSIAIALLKKYGLCNVAIERYQRHSSRCIPLLEDKELDSIWNSAVRFYKNKIVTDPAYIKPESYDVVKDTVSWDEPIPYKECKLPVFPVDALPDSIKDYCIELATFNQTPVDMPCVMALGVLGLATEGLSVVEGKKGWLQYLNLYTVTIAPPSERKSSILNAFTKMLSEYERKINTENSVKVQASKANIALLKGKKAKIEKAIIDGKASEADLEPVIKELSAAKELLPLKLYVDDCTPESLAHVMKTNNGFAGILSSEGGLFDLLRGIYTKNVNLDIYLKGYSSDSVRVDRIGRDSDDIDEPKLSIILAVQPIVLSGLMSNNIFKGRGLTARFLYSMPQSFVGERLWNTVPVSEEAEASFKCQLFDILDDRNSIGIRVISFDDEAGAILEEFANEIESRLVSDLEPISDWAGKIVGTTVRIAGILSRASIMLNMLEESYEPENLVVTKDIIENAIKIGRYFIEHAKAAHDLMGADDVTNDAKTLLKKITEKNIKEFKKSELLRLCSKFKNIEQLDPVLSSLTTHGYIMLKPQAESKASKGRPTAAIYLVNPVVFETDKN